MTNYRLSGKSARQVDIPGLFWRFCPDGSRFAHTCLNNLIFAIDSEGIASINNKRLTIFVNHLKSSTKSPILLEDVIGIVRLKHYPPYTDRTYCEWIKQVHEVSSTGERAALFEDAEAKIATFLSYLATQRQVASATKNQAMTAVPAAVAYWFRPLLV
uniref:phage integrase N-terminal SAM-like domain-containing protein n=1 Tax=Methylomonas sp. PHL2-19 TaxID=3438878 RepID=UPI00402B0C77